MTLNVLKRMIQLICGCCPVIRSAVTIFSAGTRVHHGRFCTHTIVVLNPGSTSPVHKKKGASGRALCSLACSTLLLISNLACQKDNAGTKQPVQEITIAYAALVDATLAGVALEKGFFLEHGLKVTPHIFPYGKPALDEVINGKADFATVAETPFIFAILNGEKLSIVTTIQTSNKSTAIVARTDRGIHNPNDLINKKIGVTFETTSHYFLDIFLSLNGIHSTDVSIVNLPPEILPDALKSGTVDAISVFQPYLVYAQNKIDTLGVTFANKDIYTYTFNIVARQDFIKNNPGKVNKVLRSLLKASDYTKHSQVQAKQIVADFAHIDRQIVDKIWNNYMFDISLDQSLVLVLEDQTRWVINEKITAATVIPNYLDFIYFQGLESVKPRAIRILR